MLMLELLIKLCSVIPFVLLELCPQSICFELRSPPIIMLLCVGIANFANAFNFIFVARLVVDNSYHNLVR
jgi:hypothetical protein